MRRKAIRDTSPLRVIGIDDWAWKRGRCSAASFATSNGVGWSICSPIAFATVEAWLSHHLEITVISRDRGGGYGQAATRAAPQAVQVADRWHLMENASAAFLEAVRRSMRPIRMALGNIAIDPTLLTHAERQQARRLPAPRGGLRHHPRPGQSRHARIKEIVRRTGRSRKLVRDVVRGGGGDVFRCRSNVLQPHLAWLDTEWSAGCRNGAELWRRL